MPMSPLRAPTNSLPNMSHIALILTCHAPYLRWLPEAVASIDRQLPDGAEALVVFDGCPPVELPGRWHSLAGRLSFTTGTRTGCSTPLS